MSVVVRLFVGLRLLIYKPLPPKISDILVTPERRVASTLSFVAANDKGGATEMPEKAMVGQLPSLFLTELPHMFTDCLFECGEAVGPLFRDGNKQTQRVLL